MKNQNRELTDGHSIVSESVPINNIFWIGHVQSAAKFYPNGVRYFR